MDCQGEVLKGEVWQGDDNFMGSLLRLVSGEENDVHDSVDARELSEEYHYVSVNDRTPSAGDRDEIEPGE